MDGTIDEVPGTGLADTDTQSHSSETPVLMINDIGNCDNSPVPAPSDDGHDESADDSEEDVITNYIQEETPAIEDTHEDLTMTEDALDDLFIAATLEHDTQSTFGIPAIMLTSTSPKAEKLVLEDNLKRLHSIQEGIQKLREQNSQQVPSHLTRKISLSRLSSSCPSLLEDEEQSEVPQLMVSKEDPHRHSMFNMGPEPTMEAVNADVTMPAITQQLLGVNSSNPLSVSCGNVKIHVNDLTPAGSQESLATRSNIQFSGEAQLQQQQQSSCHGNAASVEPISNRQVLPHQQHQGLDLEDGITRHRRRSWSSTDQDEEKAKIKKTLAKSQRSMSLSSLDSENDDTFFDARDVGIDEVDIMVAMAAGDRPSEKQRSFSGSSSPLHMPMTGTDCASYHSLNDYGIQNKNDKLGMYDSASCKCSKDNLAAPRSTLQKSVSTPSIIAAKELMSGNEFQATPSGHHQVYVVQSNQETDQDPSLSKRKKRGGSIFSRKKRGKEKEKDSKKSSHQFVTVCYSNSTVCDVCSKSMANKPALRCETCFVTVHEHSCKDQILDCSRFKNFHKGGAKPLHPKDGGQANSVHKPQQLPWPLLVVPGSTSISPPTQVKDKKANGNNHQHTKSTQQVSSAPTLKTNMTTSSKVINEEKESEPVEEIPTNIVDQNSTSMESLDEGAMDFNDVEDDPDLSLLDEEPETWRSTVDKKFLKKMKEKDIKRQENIYEIIITEKHHCLTLKIMQRIFAQGMLHELQMSPDIIDRLFPSLDDLIEVHMTFLRKLRERQKQEHVIERIGDLLLEQFSGEMAEQMKAAYGDFCSRHKDAVSLYKDIYKSDRKFQSFIKKISLNPVCKTRGIPECILLVTQRITKYPLLIEYLMKVTKDNKSEQAALAEANTLVKDILSSIDAQIAEREKELRLLEIYNKIDAKSATIFRSKKFKKSDVLSNNRKLRYEGPARLNQARGKVLEVTAVVLSDVIFFLLENNQKYSFVTQDNKAGVISLQKLLVREKAGQDSKGIYLISSNPSEPEMYEMVCPSQKEKKVWIEVIRSAVEVCPEEDEGIPSEGEEDRKCFEAKSAKLRELFGSLHDKDQELARLCEEKMKILAEMMDIVGNEEPSDSVKYSYLVGEMQEGPETRDMLLTALQEASRLASSLYAGGTNLNRSVSSVGEHQSEAYVSPILPKRAETFGGFDTPNKDANNTPKATASGIKKRLHLLKDSEYRAASLLNLATRTDKESSPQDGSDPFLHVKGVKEVRRASGPLPSRDVTSPDSPERNASRRSTMTGLLTPDQPLVPDKISPSVGISEPETRGEDVDVVGELLTSPPLVTLGKEQWAAALQLSHYLNTLMCLFSQHFTNIESLQAQLTLANDQISKLSKESARETRDKRHLYRHNQQLEELRNLQEQLSQERASWQREYLATKTELDKKQEEVQKQQDALKQEKNDILQQREQLFRYLENLQQRGIVVSPSMSMVGSASLVPLSESHQDNISPSSHQRSVSCDLQARDSLASAGGSNRGLNSSGSSSSASSPTQTMENTKKLTKEGGSSSKSRTNSSASLSAGSIKPVPLPLPPNLYSATNQQKTASQAPPVRQQLPLKLAREPSGPMPHQQQQHPLHHLPHKLSESSHMVTGGISGKSSSSLPLHNRSSSNSSHSSAGSNGASRSAGRNASIVADPRHSRMKDPDSNQEIIFF